MKQYTVFVCETCGLQSRNQQEIMEHEASHLGLTKEELESYNSLKSLVAHMGYHVSIKNNEETRKKFDEAIEKLLAFEMEHKIGIKLNRGK